MGDFILKSLNFCFYSSPWGKINETIDEEKGGFEYFKDE